jgi:hypothetical protein
MRPHERWWFEKLVQGRLLPEHDRWERTVICKDLHEDYARVLEKTGVKKRSTETELGLLLRRLLPHGGLEHKQRRLPVALGTRSHARWVWELPLLAICRSHFDSLMRCPMTWPVLQQNGPVSIPSERHVAGRDG